MRVLEVPPQHGWGLWIGTSRRRRNGYGLALVQRRARLGLAAVDRPAFPLAKRLVAPFLKALHGVVRLPVFRLPEVYWPWQRRFDARRGTPRYLLDTPRCQGRTSGPLARGTTPNWWQRYELREQRRRQLRSGSRGDRGRGRRPETGSTGTIDRCRRGRRRDGGSLHLRWRWRNMEGGERQRGL